MSDGNGDTHITALRVIDSPGSVPMLLLPIKCSLSRHACVSSWRAPAPCELLSRGRRTALDRPHQTGNQILHLSLP